MGLFVITMTDGQKRRKVSAKMKKDKEDKGKMDDLKEEEREGIIIANEAVKLLQDKDEETSVLMRKLLTDLVLATSLVGVAEARYLVDSYYGLQKVRVALGEQKRSLDKKEPGILIDFMWSNIEYLEKIIKKSLGKFASEYRVGKWLQSICGIGPVLSAGFLVTFDIRRRFILIRNPKTGDEEWEEAVGKVDKKKILAEMFKPRHTAGQFWSFAGYNPEAVWEKGEKRPWSARAKVLGFKLGESFVKVKNLESDFYGRFYDGFKKREIERNEAGELADQAKEKLEKCNIRKSTDAYGYYIKGRLPPNHIHARARRKVAKLLLAHLHHVMYLDYYKEIPPKPYVFSDKFSGGVHTKYVEPPPLTGIRGKSLAELYAQNKNGD